MFNIRVYGILINDKKQVLLSDEYIQGKYYTKFPGGGLELGEGTRTCLEREFREELQLPIRVGDHIYTTDFYQQSAFNPAHQIISIYYFVKALAPITVPLHIKAFDFDPIQISNNKNIPECFRFIDWHLLNENELSLPIDKHVTHILKNHV